MSIINKGPKKDLIDVIFAIDSKIKINLSYMYVTLKDFAPILVKYKLQQIRRDGQKLISEINNEIF